MDWLSGSKEKNTEWSHTQCTGQQNGGPYGRCHQAWHWWCEWGKKDVSLTISLFSNINKDRKPHLATGVPNARAKVESASNLFPSWFDLWTVMGHGRHVWGLEKSFENMPSWAGSLERLISRICGCFAFLQTTWTTYYRKKRMISTCEKQLCFTTGILTHSLPVPVCCLLA